MRHFAFHNSKVSRSKTITQSMVPNKNLEHISSQLNFPLSTRVLLSFISTPTHFPSRALSFTLFYFYNLFLLSFLSTQNHFPSRASSFFYRLFNFYNLFLRFSILRQIIFHQDPHLSHHQFYFYNLFLRFSFLHKMSFSHCLFHFKNLFRLFFNSTQNHFPSKPSSFTLSTIVQRSFYSIYHSFIKSSSFSKILLFSYLFITSHFNFFLSK